MSLGIRWCGTTHRAFFGATKHAFNEGFNVSTCSHAAQVKQKQACIRNDKSQVHFFSFKHCPCTCNNGEGWTTVEIDYHVQLSRVSQVRQLHLATRVSRFDCWVRVGNANFALGTQSLALFWWVYSRLYESSGDHWIQKGWVYVISLWRQLICYFR